MCLRAQGIDNNDGDVGRVRRSRGLSEDNGGVKRGQGIRDASEGSETTTEVAGDIRQSQVTYDDDGGVGGGI